MLKKVNEIYESVLKENRPHRNISKKYYITAEYDRGPTIRYLTDIQYDDNHNIQNCSFAGQEEATSGDAIRFNSEEEANIVKQWLDEHASDYKIWVMYPTFYITED